MERWPEASRRERGHGAFHAPAWKEAHPSRMYTSNGGGRDTYICQLCVKGKAGVEPTRTDLAAARFHNSAERQLRRHEVALTPAALALPTPANPCFQSRGVATLLCVSPSTQRYRPPVRRQKIAPAPGQPHTSTDKITQFLPPARPGTAGPLADQPSISFAGHTPRSPRLRRHRAAAAPPLAELATRRAAASGSPPRGKILGYAGHVPHLRHELDSFGGVRVWESPATTA
eukprot:TRINITY_DN19958_c0_g1_i1.p1 TRINITY_DN19958_c0_g1~~TRINITY_DN19958_c0_g1_i1.p1  ORF type:complete len:230 (+),score=44.23 TRINITY_DN19958_c0_g1_i1:98-787(+)